MEINYESRHSTFREKTLEHLFIGEVLRRLWQKGVRDAEVLFADVDAAGYDVVMEANGCLRHIQLKSSFIGSKTAKQTINIRLAHKPGGCVVWLYFDRDTLELGPFLWFGGEPGARLPDIGRLKVGKHAKANAEGVKHERPNIRLVNKGDFTRLDTIELLVAKLFGI